jgi:hypothetical protein
MTVLTDCITRIESDLAKDKISIHNEVYAIERLNDPKDIKEFCYAYKKAYAESLQRQADSGKEAKSLQLIRKGYSAGDVAVWLLRGNLGHTLGHLSTPNINFWFEHMPYYSTKFDNKIKKIRDAVDKL